MARVDAIGAATASPPGSQSAMARRSDAPSTGSMVRVAGIVLARIAIVAVVADSAGPARGGCSPFAAPEFQKARIQDLGRAAVFTNGAAGSAIGKGANQVVGAGSSSATPRGDEDELPLHIRAPVECRRSAWKHAGGPEGGGHSSMELLASGHSEGGLDISSSAASPPHRPRKSGIAPTAPHLHGHVAAVRWYRDRRAGVVIGRPSRTVGRSPRGSAQHKSDTKKSHAVTRRSTTSHPFPLIHWPAHRGPREGPSFSLPVRHQP